MRKLLKFLDDRGSTLYLVPVPRTGPQKNRLYQLDIYTASSYAIPCQARERGSSYTPSYWEETLPGVGKGVFPMLGRVTSRYWEERLPNNTVKDAFTTL